MHRLIFLAPVFLMMGCVPPGTGQTSAQAQMPSGQGFALPPGVSFGSGVQTDYFESAKIHKALYQNPKVGMYFQADEMPDIKLAQSIAAERCISVTAQLRQNQGDCQLIAVDNERLATPIKVNINLTPKPQ